MYLRVDKLPKWLCIIVSYHLLILIITAATFRDAVKTIHYGISTVRFQKARAGMNLFITKCK